MTPEKIKDYLSGLRMELIVSSRYQLADLHRRIFTRLETEAGFYAEPFLYTDDSEILLLLLKAGMAIDYSLISLDRDYLLPQIRTLCRTAGRYMRVCQSWPVQLISGVFRKIQAGRHPHERQKKFL